MANRAVFIDRDGTMAADVPYCSRPEDFVLFPDTAEALRLLNEHGYRVIVVTNQSGIARGYFSEETLARIHDKMAAELAKEGARVDGIYYCPHHPDDNCHCRKPGTGLVLQAARDLDIDLGQSFVVGDLQMDIDLGKAVGCKTVLVRDSSPAAQSEITGADAVAGDLLEAARLILRGKRRIAILTPNFSEMDGGARTAKLQAEELAREGNRVAVFCLGADMKPEGAELVVLGMPRRLFWERIYRLIFPLDIPGTIRGLSRLKGFDEVIVHLYPLTWLGYLSKKFYGARYTFWYHGIAAPRFFPRLYEKLYIWLHILGVKLTVGNVDRAVAVSRYGRKELKRYTGLDSEVVYNEINLARFHAGIDGARIREKYGLGAAPVILSVGAVRPIKGVHLLIEAFRRVSHVMPEARLLIVGRHDYDYYSRQLRQSAGAGVIFAGYVPDEDLPYYYGASNIYATGSHWEIHNRPVLEAQACGKPVVAFNIEPFQEEIDGNGVLVEIDNVAEFAKACLEKLNQVCPVGAGYARDSI